MIRMKIMLMKIVAIVIIIFEGKEVGEEEDEITSSFDTMSFYKCSRVYANLLAELLASRTITPWIKYRQLCLMLNV